MQILLVKKLEYMDAAFGDKTTVFAHALGLWHSSIAALEEMKTADRVVETRNGKLEELLKAYDNINARIVEFFLSYERDLLRRADAEQAPATRADVMRAADEVRAVAKEACEASKEACEASKEACEASKEACEASERLERRDRRARRNARIKFVTEQQEMAHSYLERAKHDPELKRLAKHQVTKNQAFDRYKTELYVLGLTTFALFDACLGARSDRLYRARKRQLEDRRAGPQTV